MCLNQPAPNPRVSITASCAEMGRSVVVYVRSSFAKAHDLLSSEDQGNHKEPHGREIWAVEAFSIGLIQHELKSNQSSSRNKVLLCDVAKPRSMKCTPRMMARERNQVPYFMCSSATIPGHPREQHAELYEKVFCWVIGSPARCHRDRWVNCFWTHGAVSLVFTPCFLLLSSKMYFGLQRKTLIFALPSLNSEWEQAKTLTFQINQSWKCVTCR